MAQRPTVISLYSGAGGLDYGFEAAGFQTRAAVEMDHDCCETLRASIKGSFIDSHTHGCAMRCRDCCHDAETGRARCAYHLAYAREHEALRRAHLRQRRCCLVCGAPAALGRRHCARHLDYYRARARSAARA